MRRSQKTCPIDTMDETLSCICLKESTDDKDNHMRRRSSGISEQGVIIEKERFKTEHLEIICDYVKVKKVSHAVAQLNKRSLCKLRCLSRNRFPVHCN